MSRGDESSEPKPPPSKAPEFKPVEARGLTPEATVDLFIEQASSMRASDLFFTSDENSVGVHARHLGVLARLDTLSSAFGRRCMNYLKAASGMDIAEHRRPLDGRWIFQRRNGSRIDLRINTLPTLHGEDFTLRLLDRDQQLRTIDGLGLMDRQRGDLLGMLNSPSGLILVTGPTGAGKTTTLYACLNYLNDGKRKINTIEDPIEYALDGVRQSQVVTGLGVDFPELLRSVLRQSPEVIMIGEIRDQLTAQTAIRAANSGHLVFATLHAPVAAAAVQSMLAMGIAPHFLSTCLRGVVAQRLFRTLCDDCRLPIDVSEAPQTFDEVRGWLEPGQGNTIYAAVGCDKCRNAGYAGRRGLFEVLTASPRVRMMISREAQGSEIEKTAIDEGMLEFRRLGLLQVGCGLTTTEEIIRVVPSEHLGIDP